MSVTQDYKSAKDLQAIFRKNHVVAVSATVCILQLVHKPKLADIVHDLKEIVDAGHADGAVNLTVFVSYADAHTLAHDGFFGTFCQGEIIGNKAVELRYCSTDEKNAFHIVAPVDLMYFTKWLHNGPASVAA